MVQRELTFLPEVERTRDLHYSEYTSRDRSLHILFQDNSVPQYRFLLEAYREIIAQYQSVNRLRAPISWLHDIVQLLDLLARRSGFTVRDLKAAGFYVVLRSRDRAYLLASRDDHAYVHVRGELVPIGSDTLGGVKRLRLVERDAQQELFPQRIKDSFLLFELDAREFENRELVVGCGDEDKNTVLDVLSRPVWHEDPSQRNTISSRFITRKLLAIAFGPTAGATEVAPGVRIRGTRPASASWTRPVVVVSLVAFLLAVGLWANKVFVRGPDAELPSTAALETGEQIAVKEPGPASQPSAREPEAQQAVQEPEPPPEPELKLAETWRQTYEEPVTSSPAVYKNWVIFGCRDGNVYALEKGTGTTLWRYATEGGVGASPAVFGESVVAADYNGNVFALNALTGEKRWTRKLPAKVVSSPCVLDDRVLVGCYDGYAYCLAGGDGSILWKKRTGARIRASSEAEDGTFYIPSYDGFLYALNKGTGEVRWRYNLKGQVAGAPVVHAGTVLIGAPDGSVYALSAADGSVRWKCATGGAVKSAPSVRAGKVYVGSNDQHLYCLNLADGSIIWKFKTEDVVLSRARVVEDVVFVGSYDGNVYAIDADTGELRDHFDTNGSIYSSPVVDEDHMYFGNNRGDFISVAYHSKETS